MEQPESDPATVQVAEHDIASLIDLLEGYKTMLLGHEKRLGVIEQLLIDTLQQPAPNRKQRRHG